MHGQDGLPAAPVGQIHGDAAIEATGPHQGRIQHVGTVGGRQQDHAGVVGKAVHLGEQLVEGLLPFVVAAADARPPLAAHRIDLVDEDDAGRLGLGLAEQVPHPTGTHPHEHLHEFRGRHREERHPGLAGDGTGQQGLARARRPHQQYTLGNAGTDGGVALRGLEEGHHLLELLLGLSDSGHILKAHGHAALRLQTRLAAAEAHRPVGHLGRAAQHHRQTGQQQQHQQAIGDQGGGCGIGPVIPHSQGHPGGFCGSQQLLVVVKHRHLDLLAALEGDLHGPLARGELQVLHLAGSDLLEQGAVTGGGLGVALQQLAQVARLVPGPTGGSGRRRFSRCLGLS